MKNVRRTAPAVLIAIVSLLCLFSGQPEAKASTETLSCGTSFDLVSSCCPGWCSMTNGGKSNFSEAGRAFESCRQSIGCGDSYRGDPFYTCSGSCH